jgi:serine/threonine protein kinase/tetratricopeptide (TPR) repeat protein
MNLSAGTSLGPYEITGLLGEGGMGEVYRAHDMRLGRDVAVKILPPTSATDADRLRRFEQEARAIAALNHPTILALFDIGTHDGVPFIVTELLEGENLQERLKGGGLTVRSAVEIAIQVAGGLAAAHAHGIVHRDVKPANVFIAKDGRVKILDFGIAKLVGERRAEGLEEQPTVAGVTEAGTTIGTLGYMAPEQLRGHAVDQRADIFSFGCVLYEMLSGRSPFLKESSADTVAAVLSEDPPFLAVQGREIPVSLGAIVNRCLEKRPLDRFSSIHDIALALQAVSQALLSDQSPVQPALKSIVVLPFENLSPDLDNAYFADGLTEEIISDLAKVRALRVISRTSAMLLRGSKKDVPTIARELNVGYVLEGSVRRAGSSLRITAQLIEAVNDAHVWAEKYTGTIDDVFDMQEKVSRAIVEALRLELTPQERQQLAERPIPNLYAYECYLRARREIFRFTEPALDKAMEYLEEGLRVLPDNPLLLAGVAHAHFQRVEIGTGQDDSLEQADAFATRAVSLAPDLPQGHLVLGLTATMRRGEIKAAIAHLKQALAADPNDWEALAWAGAVFPFVGKTSEVAAIGERLIAMDPMSMMSYMPLIWFHSFEGRVDLALGVLERGLRLCLGACAGSLSDAMRVMMLVQMDRREEAIGAADRVEKEAHPIISHRIALLWRYALTGDRQRALSWMTPEAMQTCRRDFMYSCQVACAYVMLGDTDSALDWLENAVELGFVNHHYLGEVDTLLSPLRGDPRFQALMTRARGMQAELEAHP